MFRKTVLIICWFPLTFILLIVSLSNLVRLSSIKDANNPNYPAITIAESKNDLSDNINTGQILAAHADAGDGRTLLLTKFMKATPLEPFAQTFIDEADKYGFDYRLLPAIAMCESNLGVHIPSHDSYNAWGIAVFTGQQNGATFTDWNMAIQWVSKFISEKYINRNLQDVKSIGAVWAPPSVEKGHSWANCVENFMRNIEL
jgi:hypothetical protein